MSNFSLKFNWEKPQGAKGKELRATWAYLTITVNGKPVTRVCSYAKKNKTVRDGIYLPLYPLAEWLAGNWWFLFHEHETERRKNASSYLERHSLDYAKEGYALPSLTIRPTGNKILLECRSSNAPLQRAEFIGNGEDYLDSEEVREELAGFIDTVVTRLENKNVPDTFLAALWKAIKESYRVSEEYEFCIVAAKLGLNPYNVSLDEEKDIILASQNIPAELAGEFFSAVDVGGLQKQAAWLSDTLNGIQSHPSSLSSLKDLQSDIPKIHPQLPWNEGYKCAMDLRKKLKITEKIDTLDDFDKIFGQSKGSWKSSILSKPNSYFDGLLGIKADGSPGFAVTKNRDDSKKFAICRALFEYLYVQPKTSSLISATRSEQQKRNRAFAAEFLSPSELLRECIQKNVITNQEIDEIAEVFCVSSHVIRYQIENRRLACII
ncbi:MAG: hypothetical protein GY862_05775 [Gammaproteobacteria bacterium]|nr:hypothetical protein [Gammaproteobacteria bacterium]